MYVPGETNWFFMLAMQLPILGFLPIIAALATAYMSYKQAEKQTQAQDRALQAATQGLSEEEVAESRRQGTAGIESGLARRGLLDSGLLGGSLAGMEEGILRQKAAAKRGVAPAAAAVYGQIANQPNILQTLIPLLMKYRSQGQPQQDGGRFLSQLPGTYSGTTFGR